MPRKCEGAGIIFKTSLTSCFLQESSKQKLPVAILFPGVALLVISKLCIPFPRTQRLYRLINGARHKRTVLHIYQWIHKSRNLFIYLSIHPSIHPIHVSTCMPSRPFSSLSPSPYLSSPSRSRISICEDARRGDDWHITHDNL